MPGSEDNFGNDRFDHFGSASENEILEAASKCAREVGASATHGDWRLLATDQIGTQVWFHALSGKINRYSVAPDGTLLVKILRPEKDKRPKELSELMAAGLIRYARWMPRSD